MESIFDRTIGLISKEKFAIIQNKTILIAGLGGVGGTAFEALLRTGFKHFILIDFDKISPSNLNRQILYKYDDIGKYKVDVGKKHALEINKDLDITVHCQKIDEKYIKDLPIVDFVVDAIDDVKGKVSLAKYAINNHIPLLMSLGMAMRIDPTKLEVMRLDKTTTDPLARKLRYEIKKEGLSTKEIYAVISKENPLPYKDKLYSNMMVPSACGLTIASYVLKHFIKE